MIRLQESRCLTSPGILPGHPTVPPDWIPDPDKCHSHPGFHCICTAAVHNPLAGTTYVERDSSLWLKPGENHMYPSTKLVHWYNPYNILRSS